MSHKKCFVRIYELGNEKHSDFESLSEFSLLEMIFKAFHPHGRPNLTSVWAVKRTRPHTEHEEVLGIAPQSCTLSG